MRTSRQFTALAGAGLAAAVLVGCTGLPDPTFGSGGLKVLSGQAGSAAVVLLPNGKTMVSGGDRIIRLNADGTTDPGYGSRGRLTLDPFGTGALGPDGRAYAIDRNGRLTAYTTAGKRDPAFHVSTVPRGSILDVPPSPSGDLYVTGCSSTCTVWRYFPNGRRDTTFVHRTSASDVLQAVGRDGSVYFSTDTEVRNGHLFSLQKLTTAGAVDRTFATDGRLSLPLNVRIWSVAVDAANRVTMSVNLGTNGGYPIAPFVLRFTARGTADLTFGWLGIVAMPGSNSRFGGPVTIDRLGRTVTASSPVGEPAPLRVYRYLRNGSPDRTFGVSGVSVISSVRGVQMNGQWTNSLVTDAANRITVGTAVAPVLVVGLPTTAVLRLTG